MLKKKRAKKRAKYPKIDDKLLKKINKEILSNKFQEEANRFMRRVSQMPDREFTI